MSLRYEAEMETAKTQGELAEQSLFTGNFQEVELFSLAEWMFLLKNLLAVK